jgi:hypothetical protein
MRIKRRRQLALGVQHSVRLKIMYKLDRLSIRGKLIVGLTVDRPAFCRHSGAGLSVGPLELYR